MGLRYSVGGLSADTAATADHVAANLWNPDTTASIYVVEIRCVKVGATLDNHSLRRTTTRGTTPGSTVTPDIDNNYERMLAPPSGALLDLAAYSAQPTVDGSVLERAVLPAAAGAGYAWVYPQAITVPPGTGLAVVTPTAVVLQDSNWTFIWDELGP